MSRGSLKFNVTACVLALPTGKCPISPRPAGAGEQKKGRKQGLSGQYGGGHEICSQNLLYSRGCFAYNGTSRSEERRTWFFHQKRQRLSGPGTAGARRRGEGRIEGFGGCPSAGRSGCVTQRLNTRVTGEQRACDRSRGPNGCEFVLRNSRIAAEANIKWRNIEPCVVL